MEQKKYDWPDEIPDEAIREQFANANEVRFSARNFNRIQYRDITFGDLGWWLPLTRVLPLIGITPQMLIPVFNFRPKKAKQLFSFSLGPSWFRLAIKGSEIIENELPKTYEQLDAFPLSDKPFQELARILGKSIKVMREDGGTGEHYYLFTAHPNGSIVQARETQ